MNSNISKLMEEVKLLLLLKPNFGFFMTLLHKLEFQEAPDNLKSDPNFIACFEGFSKNIYLHSEKLFEKYSAEERVFVVAHEIMHYALMTDIRMAEASDKQLANIASDYIINQILVDIGLKAPTDILLNRHYMGHTQESLYDHLFKKNFKSENKTQFEKNIVLSNDVILSNQVSDLNSIAKEQLQKLTEERFNELISAEASDKLAARDKAIGITSKAFSKIFEKFLKPKINWKEILQNYINFISQGDYNFYKCNRRLLAKDIYFPEKEDLNNLNEVYIAVDVSGSISEEEIKQFITDIYNIYSYYKIKVINVITFNTKIVQMFKFDENTDLTKIEFYIGGGTDIVPVFDYLKNQPVEFLIVLTDMIFDQKNLKKPNYDTIWMVKDNPDAKIPFGKLIIIE